MSLVVYSVQRTSSEQIVESVPIHRSVSSA
jgi:hypothetical protein